jgi:hypothetical protein
MYMVNPSASKIQMNATPMAKKWDGSNIKDSAFEGKYLPQVAGSNPMSPSKGEPSSPGWK